jgi:hypothetical protein
MTPQAVDQQEMTPSPSLLEQSNAKREFWLTIVALTAVYVVAVALGNRRYIWFDELFTFDIGRSSSLHQLWYRVLRFDCTPPASYLLSRFSMSTFGATPFGLRFPSMIEFYFGSMAILLYVRRKVGLPFAAVAVLLLWVAGPTLYYAVEARAYALLFLSFACLLLSWDTAIRAMPRGWPLVGISISTLALVGAHVFAPFTLFAFIVAEAVRFRRLRRPDYPMWTALLLPMLAMLLYIPLVRLYGGLVFTDLTRASVRKIQLFFDNTLNAQVTLMVLLAALVVRPAKKLAISTLKLLPEEVALFVCLFLSPVLLNLVLMRRHGAFFDRYSINSQVAILVALAVFIAHQVRLSRPSAYAAAAVLFFFLVKTQILQVLRNPYPKNAAFLASIQPNLPIVIGQGQVFMEMNQWENPELLTRLYFLKDQQASLQYAHTNYFQDFEAPDVMRKAGFPFSANVAPYAGFVQQHKQFFLFGSQVEWVFLKLRSTGASIAFVDDYGDRAPYLDKTLYLVTMPSSQSQE